MIDRFSQKKSKNFLSAHRRVRAPWLTPSPPPSGPLASGRRLVGSEAGCGGWGGSWAGGGGESGRGGGRKAGRRVENFSSKIFSKIFGHLYDRSIFAKKIEKFSVGAPKSSGPLAYPFAAAFRAPGFRQAPGGQRGRVWWMGWELGGWGRRVRPWGWAEGRPPGRKFFVQNFFQNFRSSI